MDGWMCGWMNENFTPAALENFEVALLFTVCVLSASLTAGGVTQAGSQ